MAGVGADSLDKFFIDFINKKWKDEDAYDLVYFSSHYNIKQNVSQYYLRKLTYNKVLCCVKIRNKTYYLKRKWFDHFKIFENKLDYVKVF